MQLENSMKIVSMPKNETIQWKLKVNSVSFVAQIFRIPLIFALEKYQKHMGKRSTCRIYLGNVLPGEIPGNSSCLESGNISDNIFS